MIGAIFIKQLVFYVRLGLRRNITDEKCFFPKKRVVQIRVKKKRKPLPPLPAV
jgi:hypothetical protein